MPELNQLPISPAESPTPELPPSGDPAAAAAAPTSPANEPGVANPFGLPPEIASLPAVQLVSVGSPPAIRVGPGEYYPEIDAVVDNLPKVLQSGLDVYRSMKDEFVFFNPLFISEDELKYLDEQGKLADSVPDYGQVTGSQPQEIPDDQIASYLDRGDQIASGIAEATQGAPEEKPTNGPGTPTPVPAPTPQEQAAVMRNQQQAMSAMGGPPTSGPRPGGGRLLNALLQPPPQ